MPTGKPLGSLKLPPATAPALSVGDSAIVFRVGRSIRVADVDDEARPHGRERGRYARSGSRSPGAASPGPRTSPVAGASARSPRTVKTSPPRSSPRRCWRAAPRPAAPTLIVFAADRAPAVTGDVYRVDASGRVTNLTHSPWQETMPVVSPNGKLVAFVSDRLGGGVWTIGIDGSGLRLVSAEGIPVPVLDGDGVVARQPHARVHDGRRRLEPG